MTLWVDTPAGLPVTVDRPWQLQLPDIPDRVVTVRTDHGLFQRDGSNPERWYRVTDAGRALTDLPVSTGGLLALVYASETRRLVEVAPGWGGMS